MKRGKRIGNTVATITKSLPPPSPLCHHRRHHHHCAVTAITTVPSPPPSPLCSHRHHHCVITVIHYCDHCYYYYCSRQDSPLPPEWDQRANKMYETAISKPLDIISYRTLASESFRTSDVSLRLSSARCLKGASRPWHSWRSRVQTMLNSKLRQNEESRKTWVRVCGHVLERREQHSRSLQKVPFE